MGGLIIGIDEVGRGPLAGPLVMGACALKPIDATDTNESWQEELTDSKRLTEKKRLRLAETIRERAVLLGIGKVEAEEIDRIGLAEALRMAARMAFFQAIADGESRKIDAEIEEIIIDGPQNFLKETAFEEKVTTMNKADLLVKPVSAAAIVAKVYRDGLMREMANIYPEYDFQGNVGYGTKKHLAALAEIGPCVEHRFSYKPVQRACEGRELEPAIQKRYEMVLGRTTTASKRQAAGMEAFLDGQKAEMVVTDYLIRNGQTILARNFKTRYFEIDIVSATAERIYFTEVKYRKNTQHGKAIESITKEKQEQMHFGAEAFMLRLATALGRKVEDLPTPQLAVGVVEGASFTLKNWFPLD